MEAGHFVVIGLANGSLDDDQIVWWRDRAVNDSRGVQGTWNGHWIRLDRSSEANRGRGLVSLGLVSSEPSDTQPWKTTNLDEYSFIISSVAFKASFYFLRYIYKNIKNGQRWNFQVDVHTAASGYLKSSFFSLKQPFKFKCQVAYLSAFFTDVLV